DLVASVRGAYFGVLVAEENVRVNELLTRFSDTAFRIQVGQLKAGIAAVYEPMQLRVLSFQGRAALLTSRNAYTAAWKTLATTLGRPDLPPTELAGRLDRMAVPRFVYDEVLARVLTNNTDVQTAANGIHKARYNLLAAQVTPVPDPNLHVAVQKDYTTPPNTIVTTVSLGAALPVWDQNKGNIIQAQAALVRAIEEPHRVRDDLSNRVADAFNRYQTNVMTLDYYRDQILPDQVRAYQQLRVRYNVTAGDVAFGDIVTAQQTLGGLIATYLTTITAEWTAVVDLAHLLQTDELFDHLETSGPAACGPLANLEQLLTLPCTHPCNPMPTPTPVGVDSSWPLPQGGLTPSPASATETLTLPAPRKVGQADPAAPVQIDFD
ncbi:MAG TPA: TolC family protein, partial [Gemmataceae bacterium]|nr:TolC family protein [Gemmataceae bacterium]